ncbi:hypothetical protein C5748_27490, partial [Phyllobacterium phragmitis]
PFKAGPIGNAQTGPQTVGDLEAPTIQVPGSTIAAKDIASQTMVQGALVTGLPVFIQHYPGTVAIGDTITLYAYLAGKDALTGAVVKNICTVDLIVANGDPILKGDPQPIVVPQAYLAGYGPSGSEAQPQPGTLQMNYKVTQGGGSTWSKLATPDGTAT